MDLIEPIDEGKGGRFKQIRHPKQRDFLRQYSKCATVQHACERADIDRSTFHAWIKEDPEFIAAYEDAKEMAFEVLEREANKRAVKGRRKLVVSAGRAVIVPVDPMNPGGDKEYLYEYVFSDALLMFLMKALRPHIYGGADALSTPERESRDGYDDLAALPPAEAEEVLNKIDAAHRQKSATAN